MSDTIDQHFIRDYEADAHLVFQREGSFLRAAVRRKDNVLGKSTTFQKAGKGTATTKARHGEITPMNATQSSIECTFSDFYAGDYIDKLDEAKTNVDERMVIAMTGAYALGRKVDDQLTTAMDATTQTTVSWTVTSAAEVRNSLLKMVKALDANSVPRQIGQRYGILTPTAWAMAETVEQFSSADYVGPDGLPFKEGAPPGGMWRLWNGVLWGVHDGLPGVGTAAAKVFAWHKMAVGYGTGAHAGNVASNGPVKADISWVGPRAAHFVNHMMSGGACLIDDTGVIEGNLDDTANIPTT